MEMESKGSEIESTRSDMFYSIVAPKVIRPFSNYDVVISVLDNSEPYEFELSLKGNKFSKTREVKVDPNTLELIRFEIPDIAQGSYNFVAKGIKGVNFEKNLCLSFDNTANIVLIQTDKATYKPGDEVRFRVIFLGKDTKPLKYDIPIKVIITDPDNNQIKQFNDVKLTCGVFSGDLQLSTYPPLGKWSLKVFIGEKEETKTFEIEKYVLPKFKVEVTAPKAVCAKDKKVRVNVSAKYTYGKGVKGEAVARFFIAFGSQEKFIKTTNIKGEGFFDVDIKDFECRTDSYYIKVSVIVIEDLTGSEMSAETSFTIHQDRHKISFREYPYRFKSNVPLPLKISVKDFNGKPVKGESSLPVIIYFKALNKKTQEKSEQQFHTEIKLDNKGFGEANVTLPENEVNEYTIYGKYLDTEVHLGNIYKDFTLEKREEILKLKQESDDKKYFNVEVKEKVFRLYQNVPVEVSTNYKTKNCIYCIVARQNIVQCGKAEFQDGIAKFNFLTTYDMVTSVSVLVYALNLEDNSIITTHRDVTLPNLLPNFVHILTPAEAQTKDEIDITVRTKPDSYVGLMAVDQSVLLHRSGNDFTDTDVFTNLNKFNAPASFYGDTFFSIVELISNATVKKRVPAPMVCFGASTSYFGAHMQCRGLMCDTIKSTSAMSSGSSIPVQIKERDWFPESWIMECSYTSESGELTLRRTVPDTITSWILTGFSISPLYGFGMSRSPAQIKVFQQFFISTNLPYSVKRGEVVAVPLTIFNYMDENLKAEVTLDNTNQDFVFIDVNGDGAEEPSYDAKRTKSVTVESGNGANASFLICPNKVGHIAIKVRAITPIAGDAVSDILRVEPEGITKYENRAIFFNLKEKPEIQENVVLDIPKDAVPDSVFIEISAVGDLLGPTIQNLGSLVRMPYGCGEQNMVNFVPNILVLKYLQCIDKLTGEIVNKAKKYLEIGYQRELTYKHPNGSYSAFGGDHDKNGSTWLTAYVARSFREAAEFIEIDERVIKDAIYFLIKNQKKDGSFPEVGKLFDWGYWSDTTKGISLTAFSLSALIANQKQFPELEENIKNGMEYLIKNVDSSTDVHSLAIVSYILQKAKHEKKDEITKRLIEKAVFRSGLAFWTSDKEKDEEDGKTCSVEITAYGLLAILESDTSESVTAYLKGLISKKNSAGGFESTQDTVVGLTALMKFSEKYCVGKADTEISFSDEKGTKGKLVTNSENAFLLQSHELNADARNISINVKGQGSSFVQVSYRYNVDTSGKRERFNLRPIVKETSNIEFLELIVYTSFIPVNNELISNMVVMEVSLPSGYLTDSDNLKELEKCDRIKRIETKNGNSIVVIYFDNLDSAEVSYLIRGIRAYQVAKQKPAPVVIYDYYDTNRKAQAFYNCPEITLNDILVEA